ncbi:MAG: hypothetical protein ACOCZE_12095 [Planctomycetota bacterium]
MHKQRWLIMAGLLVSLASASPAEPEATEVTIPHAGCSLRLPGGYVPQVPDSPWDAMQAVYASGEEVLGLARLTVEPVRQGLNAERFLLQDFINMRKAGGSGSLKILKQVKLPLAGRTGAGRLMSLGEGANMQYIAQAAIVRKVEGQQTDLAYMVTVIARASQKESLIDRFQMICESMKLTDLKDFSQVPLTMYADPVVLPHAGISVQVPRGWHAAAQGFQAGLGMVDFQSGSVAVSGGVSVSAPANAVPAEQQIRNILQQRSERKQAAEQAGQDVSGLPSYQDGGEVKLGSLTGHALIIRDKAGGTITMLAIAVHTWPEDGETLQYTLQFDGPLEKDEYFVSAVSAVAENLLLSAPPKQEPQAPAQAPDGPAQPDQPDQPAPEQDPTSSGLEPANPVPSDGTALPGVGD